MLEVVGVKDILSKIQGSDSKLNNVYATIKALEMLVLIDNKDKKENKTKKIEKKTEPKTKEKTQGVKNGSDKPKKTSK